MSSPSSTTTHVWIDLVLIGAGGALAHAGWPVAGALVAGFGVMVPAVRWFGGRGRSVDRAIRLVPPELASAHQEVVAAATLADPAAVDAADDLVLEAAAIFAGRPVRGGAQRRYVQSRAETLAGMAAELTERAEALSAAHAELAPYSVDVYPPASADRDTFAMVLLVVFAPAFVVWEVLAGVVTLSWALADGVMLRGRTLGRLTVRGATTLVGTVSRTVRRWSELRQRVKASWQEARHRFVAAKLRLRLRLRLARRAARAHAGE
jgi:hypothetical protein